MIRLIILFLFSNFLFFCSSADVKKSNTKSNTPVIEKFFRKEISGELFLRELIKDSKWYIISEMTTYPQLKIFKDKTGKLNGIMVFSDLDKLNEAKKTEEGKGFGDLFMEVDGEKFFKNLDQKLDEVNINPYTNLAIFYKKNQIPRIKQISSVLELEDSIANSSPNLKENLKSYDSYFVILQNKKNIIPTNENKLAIFTSELSLKAFADSPDTKLKGKVEVVQMNSETLFKKILTEEQSIFQFNPKGVFVTKEFPKIFASEVLK